MTFTSTWSCFFAADDLLQASGHGPAEVLQGDALGPDLDESLLQLGHQKDVLGLQLVLHVILYILNWV
jgi:hypothetical protein